MKLKHNILLFLFIANSMFGFDIMTSNKSISYNEVISYDDVYIKKYGELPVRCEIFDINLLKNKNKKFLAKHYIQKDIPICDKDIYEYKDEKLLFDFGNIQIEKNAKIIYENDTIIKIKEPDGNIEKIYKNGRVE